MSTNLVQLADRLKYVPDAQLAHEAQNPSAGTPPYLVLAELQRRKTLRAGSSSGPPPSSTVAQDTVQDTLKQIAPPVPQGPPPPPGMAPQARGGAGPMPGAQPPANVPKPPQAMAHGGAVGYATGDLVDDDDESQDNTGIINTDVDDGLLQEIRRRESSGNYRATKRKSTASGAYQMINPTWKMA